ncbi:unnamed protein product [Rotaria sp. Silwood1]|nr:unnamed protein product [Rotaria sp. Silwood1]CAF0900004.1 unnamed protein product [Rotaria sp. Silwood1]CAF3370782.1 unnamed protein product [Rotaria sp. Silwood1]CAF4516379.1 unnamed protein product [Rotaria sp. Silwood1]CAF4872741.1 unnamed protein product [Rotaria sp. Silwood1]
MSSNQMATSNDNHQTDSSQIIIPPSTNQQQQQDVPVNSSSTIFHVAQVTTAISPLDNHQPEDSQTVKPKPVPSTKTLQSRQDQNVLRRKSKSTVATHVIDGWTIQESLKPFQQQENKSSLSSSKKRVQLIFTENPNVHQWNINEVCSFFEYVLGKNCYATIIKEHLIDGTALLLLKEEHLINTFKMPVELRLELLQRIDKLKHGDLSLL